MSSGVTTLTAAGASVSFCLERAAPYTITSPTFFDVERRPSFTLPITSSATFTIRSSDSHPGPENVTVRFPYGNPRSSNSPLLFV
jgi:hypothetical protein